MFYQYVETGCAWSWGLLWGHAVSKDLVTWQHLPPALAPTFGGFDGDGCFSGCCTLDVDGTPTILYTGVRLRSSDACGPLPPSECDLGTACVETQCIAVGDPADPKLTYWTKEEAPFLALPPPKMNLTAWRDPYVIGRPGQDGQTDWTIMIGAGVKDTGGSAMVYRSQSLRGGDWTYAGELCRGKGDTGVIWECPVMLNLPLMEPRAPRGKEPPPQESPAPVCVMPTHVSPRSPPSPSLFSIISSPASPRPAISLAANSAAAALDIIEGRRSALTPQPEHELGGSSLLAAVLSPRRPASAAGARHTVRGGLSSPLRSPERWRLASALTLPASPSSPAPRLPPRHMGTESAGPLSPTAAQRRAPPSSSSRYLQPHSEAQEAAAPSSSAAGIAGREAALATPGSPAAMARSATPFTGGLEAKRALSPSSECHTAASPVVKQTAAAGGGLSAAARHAVWQRHRTFFCVCPDDCNSMAVYYLGTYDPRVAAYDLEGALGPFPMDLGDIFYAPNTLVDPQGRNILWGWLQEKPRKVGSYDYAGCLSMPRILSIEVVEEAKHKPREAANASAASKSNPGVSPSQDSDPAPAVYLVQRPPDEIAKLRVPGSEWMCPREVLDTGEALPLPLTSGHYLELNLTMAPTTSPHTKTHYQLHAQSQVHAAPDAGAADGAANRCSGLLLHCWTSGAAGSAALLYHWDSGVLEMVFESMDPHTLAFSLAGPNARRVGGRLQRPPAPGEALSLRVFIDFSVIEIFTDKGEVLTARVYRGVQPRRHATPPPAVHLGHTHAAAACPGGLGAPPAEASGVELVSFGCGTEFTGLAGYEMAPMWVDEA